MKASLMLLPLDIALMTRGISLYPRSALWRYFNLIVRIIITVNTCVLIWEDSQTLSEPGITSHEMFQTFSDIVNIFLSASSALILSLKEEKLQNLIRDFFMYIPHSFSLQRSLLKVSITLLILTMWKIPFEIIRYRYFFKAFFTSSFQDTVYQIVGAFTLEIWFVGSIACYYFAFFVMDLCQIRTWNLIYSDLTVSRKPREKINTRRIIFLLSFTHRFFRRFESLLSLFPFLWVTSCFFSLSGDIVSLAVKWKDIQRDPWYLTGYSVIYYVAVFSVVITLMSRKERVKVSKLIIIRKIIVKSQFIGSAEKLSIIKSIRDTIDNGVHTGYSFFQMRKLFLPTFFSVTFAYTIIFIQSSSKWSQRQLSQLTTPSY
jgi:hypothetical protein